MRELNSDENPSCGFSIKNLGVALGVAPRIRAQILRSTYLLSESCSESTPELPENSENGLSTPRVFLRLGLSQPPSDIKKPGLRSDLSKQCIKI